MHARIITFNVSQLIHKLAECMPLSGKLSWSYSTIVSVCITKFLTKFTKNILIIYRKYVMVKKCFTVCIREEKTAYNKHNL